MGSWRSRIRCRFRPARRLPHTPSKASSFAVFFCTSLFGNHFNHLAVFDDVMSIGDGRGEAEILFDQKYRKALGFKERMISPIF